MRQFLMQPSENLTNRCANIFTLHLIAVGTPVRCEDLKVRGIDCNGETSVAVDYPGALLSGHASAILPALPFKQKAKRNGIRVAVGVSTEYSQ